LRNEKELTEISKNGFWYIKIVHNYGIGFGGLKNNLLAINAIQSFMFILLFFIFMSIYQSTLTSIFISLAMFGGLFNLLQRAIDHG
jgi:lipoprotein signal peptidase